VKVKFDWTIQDGKLSPDTGRLVVHDGESFHTNGPSADHNDLITSLAARYRFSRSEVASRGYRFYWRWIDRNEIIQVSPVRRIDEDWVEGHRREFLGILEREFGRRRRRESKLFESVLSVNL